MPLPGRQCTTTRSPGADLSHLGAHLQNQAARLVTEQMGQVAVRPFHTIDFAQLRAANPGGLDVNKDLSKAQNRHLDLGDFKGFALLD